MSEENDDGEGDIRCGCPFPSLSPSPLLSFPPLLPPYLLPCLSRVHEIGFSLHREDISDRHFLGSLLLFPRLGTLREERREGGREGGRKRGMSGTLTKVGRGAWRKGGKEESEEGGRESGWKRRVKE